MSFSNQGTRDTELTVIVYKYWGIDETIRKIETEHNKINGTPTTLEIKRVQEEHGILCEWIFTDGNGSYTHARNITDCMTRLCRENKLNGGGITKLRKTTSSDLQAKGTPKSVVASMLGHTTEVNEKYYTYDTSNLAEKKKIIQERNAKFKNLAHTG